MTKIVFALFFVFLIQQAFAVEIHQVLYDPLNSETGGEAIELYNSEDVDISLDGWTVATSVSDQDITFPKNATIGAHSYFLVADKDWNNVKDNPDWKVADYEETMTLPNSDSGIALKNKNGTVIDAVGWGKSAKIKNSLYSGVPVKTVNEGLSLVRVSGSGDNSNDFVEQLPNFVGENSVVISVAVDEPAQKIRSFKILEDDAVEAGVQISPVAGKARNITLLAEIDGAKNPYANFDGKIFALTKANNTHYAASILLDYTLAPKNYSATLYSGDNSATTAFAYLPLKKFEVRPNAIKFRAGKGQTSEVGKISIKNVGNVGLSLSIASKELKSKNSTISVDNFLITFGSENVGLSNKRFQLMPGVEKEMILSITIPEDAVNDNYTTVLKFVSD